MDNQASRIPNNLEDAPADHAGGEAPRLGPDALVGVDEQRQAKDGDEDGVGGDVGLVSQDAVLDGAQVEGAVGQGAKGDHAAG